MCIDAYKPTYVKKVCIPVISSALTYNANLVILFLYIVGREFNLAVAREVKGATDLNASIQDNAIIFSIMAVGVWLFGWLQVINNVD